MKRNEPNRPENIGSRGVRPAPVGRSSGAVRPVQGLRCGADEPDTDPVQQDPSESGSGYRYAVPLTRTTSADTLGHGAAAGKARPVRQPRVPGGIGPSLPGPDRCSAAAAAADIPTDPQHSGDAGPSAGPSAKPSAEPSASPADTKTGRLPDSRPSIDADIYKGLTSEQVQEQIRLDHVNHPVAAPTRTVRQIVRTNIVTPFNILNFVLAGLVILASLARPSLIINTTFLGVVISNIVVGIVQEIRAKKTIDRLAILTEPHVTVVRDAESRRIPVHELVIGDIMQLEAGNQISVDATFISGQGFEVDESLLTGESDNILKATGDDLYSGSVVMAGTGYARVENVGSDTFAAKIATEAKQTRHKPSVIMSSLNRIIKILSLVMMPVGLALFVSNYNKAADGNLPATVVSVVAALIGMIPEGLMLLTSIAFAVGVINLARRKMLVQTLPSIETLARVDTICLDKTGTITNGQMDVQQFNLFDHSDPPRLIDPQQADQSDAIAARAAWITDAVAAVVKAQSVSNATQDALRAYFNALPDWQAEQVVPFSSKRKWSGVQFAGQGTFVMGAPEFILGDAVSTVTGAINRLASQGLRVILVAHSDGPFRDEDGLPEQLTPVAAVALVDQLRENVRDTLRYFKEQGVTVKVISGDNPRTVSAVAASAGVEQADRWLDMSCVEADANLQHLVETYTLFGRVTPFQKRELLRAMQANGHIVSMTGDGVNDVLALKEADCSVAMAAGSDAARAAADLVLLDNNVAAMVDAVYEGRRVINNIERVASLFLVKTVYSCMLSILYIFLPFVYPLLPIQISLISGLTIGFPAFVLALKPNRDRVQGNFLRNIILRSVPGGITAAIMIVLSQIVGYVMKLSYVQCSTIAVLILGFMGLLVLLQVSRPMDALRRLLFVICAAGLLGAILIMPRLFFLARIITPIFWIYLPCLLLTYWLYAGLQNIGRLFSQYRQKRQAANPAGTAGLFRNLRRRRPRRLHPPGAEPARGRQPS